MANSVTINLLPKEVLQQRQRSVKIALGYKISVILLIVLAVTSSAILSVRFGQKIRLQESQKQIKETEDKIKQLWTREEQALIVKQRQSTIGKVMGADESRKVLFDKMTTMLPQGIKLNQTTVDTKGGMQIEGNTVAIEDLDNYIQAINSADTEKDLVKRVDLLSLSLDRKGNYHFVLQVSPPGGK